MTDGGELAGYGWLDSEWGDARITFFVAPGQRGRGVGDFILEHLEDEAAARGLNYIYNVVPETHPDGAWIRNWLSTHGFHEASRGQLRRQVSPTARHGPQRVTAPHPLDNPVRSSLTGPHARFAERRGNVLRYPVDVSPFLALPDQPDAADWADAAALAGPGARVALAGVRVPPPDGWQVTPIGEGVQIVEVESKSRPPPTARRCGWGRAMCRRCWSWPGGPSPGRSCRGPWSSGSYLGIRRGGALVAMAGERLHPPGWTEISAVCTDDAWRGLGFASRLSARPGGGYPGAR